MADEKRISDDMTRDSGAEGMNFSVGNVRIQKFITEFSVPFTQSYDFDELIDNALYELRDFTATDRAIILEFQPDGLLLCTHENVINDKTPKVLGRSLPYEAKKPILDEADKTGCFYEKEAARYFQKHPATDLGEKSFCYIPLTIGGNRAGYLVFATIFEQANWAEGEFRLATMAGSIIAGAYSRKKSEDALLAAKEAELRTQEFISRFSVPFTQPYDFDELIDNALYELRDFTVTDRAVILEFQPDGSLLCTYENRINERTPKVFGRSLEYETMLPILDEADKTGCFYEKEAFRYFQKHPATDLGEKSFCYIPLMVEGERAGYLVFATIFEQANWAEGEFRLATMAGSILAGAFSMREGETALREATLAAQQASIAKSQFLSNMSHEIRTPMNAILGMTQIAGRTSDIEKLRKCIETIEISSKQLLSIINDVLDISQIESGKLRLNETVFSLERIILKACSLISARVNDKGIKLSINMDSNLRLRYWGDDIRISQILSNLLSNAVKFTPEGGSITVTAGECGGYEESGGAAVIRMSVEDTGIGMTEEQLRRVFNSFEQADGSISRQYGGTGLGLAITKNLAEMMNGSIDVESEYGAGTKFTARLAIGRADNEEKKVVQNLRARFSGLRILVITNRSEISSKFSDLAKWFSLSCDVTDNCVGAISMLHAALGIWRPYSAVFFDFQLHGEASLKAYPEIERLAGAGGVIFITEYGAWDSLGGEIEKYGVVRKLEAPLFVSAICDMLTNVVNDIKSDGIQSGGEPHYSGVTVLLAEDVEINRIIICSLLEETGITIDSAENGRIAAEMFLAAPDRYDMIFMDIQMPGMNGLDATRAIRALDLPRAKTVPIVAMTANAFKEDADECLAAGMNDHLAKPITAEALHTMLHKWLSSCTQ